MRLKNLLLGIHTKNKLSNISTSFFKSYNQKSNLYSFTCKKYNSPSSYQNLHFSSINSYKLDDEFVNLYKDKVVNFGFNGLGELVYRRTYSRIKDDGTNEQWWETVRRVVEGTFNMLVDHINENHIRTTDDFKAEIKKDSMVMFDKIFNFKFLPPGRGLWSMGTNITEKKKIYAALNNCAFVSTKPVDRSNIDDIVKPYAFLMDCAMLGVGVGFDTKASSMNIKIFPLNKEHHKHYIVEDSREGWVESLKVLLKSFFQEDQYQVVFDYSQLRAAGKPLKIFGGVSAGPQPLIDLHRNISKLLENNAGKKLSSRVIVDIMNYIGKSVVAGNIRRTAEIALGEPYDEEFIELKNYSKFPERSDYGWVSNNSIYAELGMDYTKIVDNIINNGEPGLLWLENMRKYSRMCDNPDYRDRLAAGGNPCLEQTLESFELCCLAETFPFHHGSREEYIDTLKYAFLYAKIVTLGLTMWQETNNVMSRNRRIGISMTGIIQFLNKFGIHELKNWSEEGFKYLKNYDRLLSNFLQIPESIKITSIKPSGTVSLLGGATPGIHYPHSRFYIRRVRLSNNSPLIKELINNGYHVEPDVMQPDTTVVVSFPIDIGKGVKTIKDTNMFEQLALASFMQKYWADNQVSCTVTFNKATEGQHLASALNYYQYELKGISFLPSFENSTPYPQMPYEEIDEEKYSRMIKTIKSSHLSSKLKQEQVEKHDSNFCDSDSCSII